MPALLGSDQLRSVSIQLRPAQRGRLGSASLRLAQARSARLGPAWHGFGRVWLPVDQLIEFALAQARSVVDRGQVGPKVWPGRQSGGIVHAKEQLPKIMELRGEKQ